VSAADSAAKLKALIARGEPDAGLASPPAAPDTADPALAQLVYSFLLWEAGPDHAGQSLTRILSETVDYNELRICTRDELVSLVTNRHPRATERCERLRSTLQDVYEREHRLSLETLCEQSKRDARAYLESLDGIPHFVSARVLLLTLGGHRFPVDSRIVGLLHAEGLCADRKTDVGIASELERAVRAGGATDAYLSLESLARSVRGRRSRRRTRARDAESAKTPGSSGGGSRSRSSKK